MAKRIYDWSSDIVYGVIVRGGKSAGALKVLHIYRGTLRPGQTIAIRSGWGYERPNCGMVMLPPLLKGQSGVIAFNGSPTFSPVYKAYLDAMFETGLIQHAQPAAIDR